MFVLVHSNFVSLCRFVDINGDLSINSSLLVNAEVNACDFANNSTLINNKTIEITSYTFLLGSLDEICYIHRHFVNPSVVEFFYVIEGSFVIISNKVDCNAFSAKTSTAPNSEKRN